MLTDVKAVPWSGMVSSGKGFVIYCKVYARPIQGLIGGYLTLIACIIGHPAVPKESALYMDDDLHVVHKLRALSP